MRKSHRLLMVLLPVNEPLKVTDRDFLGSFIIATPPLLDKGGSDWDLHFFWRSDDDDVVNFIP